MKNTNILIIGIVVLGLVSYFIIQKNMIGEIINDGTEKSDKFSFFITSKNPGAGGDFGGLSGADAYCQQLGSSVGGDKKTWSAYLSTGGESVVNAKDRIGTGPWYNIKGELIANNLIELHGQNNLNKDTALNELGQKVFGRGDTPNEHDILTGSDNMGNFYATSTDSTCNNWTSSTTGSAVVGHHDRIGINDSAPMKSWVNSHLTRGCSVENFKTTGGAGLIYCFAK
jgi:hypothetical protein